MQRKNAFHTVANAMNQAKAALKPAIADLASVDGEDYYLESVMRMYLSILAQERKAERIAADSPREY